VSILSSGGLRFFFRHETRHRENHIHCSVACLEREVYFSVEQVSLMSEADSVSKVLEASSMSRSRQDWMESELETDSVLSGPI
jgi:hypothetical protein